MKQLPWLDVQRGRKSGNHRKLSALPFLPQEDEELRATDAREIREVCKRHSAPLCKRTNVRRNQSSEILRLHRVTLWSSPGSQTPESRTLRCRLVT